MEGRPFWRGLEKAKWYVGGTFKNVSFRLGKGNSGVQRVDRTALRDTFQCTTVCGVAVYMALRTMVRGAFGLDIMRITL